MVPQHIQPGRLYKHDRNQDVAIRVLKVVSENADEFLVRVAWQNIGECHPTWDMDIHETIRIRKDALTHWREIYG